MKTLYKKVKRLPRFLRGYMLYVIRLTVTRIANCKLPIAYCLLPFAFCFLPFANLFSQVPQGINYQAVARNTAGNVLATQTITVRLTVEQGSAGTPLYVEVDTATTNQFGLFTIKLGMQNAVSGTFSSIIWSSGDKWLKVEMDPAAGNAFVNMGESQLLSVPYALYSANGTPGPTGATGATGTNGATGATGAQGFIGPTGPTGSTGSSGNNGDRYATTSTTSMSITIGSHSFTVGIGLQYSFGQTVLIANSVTNYMTGTLVTYNSVSGAITVNVTSIVGSGTFASWSVNLNGAPGPAGATGATGAAGTNGTNGATGATGATGTNGTNGVTGATGAAGTNGTNGATGATGAAGTNGTNGTNGATGATGAAGTNGTNGATGATGVAGATGAQGLIGLTGPTGPTGSSGANGDRYATTSTTSMTISIGSHSFTVGTGLQYSVGQIVLIANSAANQMTGSLVTYNSVTGAITVNVTSILGSGTFTSWNVNLNGAPGPAGATGATGVAGATGATGIAGATGATGVAGATGATGVAGATGATGVAGATGATGVAGATGATGVAGATGATGVAGATGATGVAGATGATGVAGATGVTGVAGATGATGVAGATGATGIAGATGATGVAGATGATGAANISGTTNYVVKFTGATSGGNSQIFDDGTNVGIGTIPTNAKLQVNNTSGQVGIQVDGNNSNWSSIYINALTAGARPGFGYLQGTLLKGSHWIDTNGDWYLDVNSGERMRVTTTGNVGIGTITPASKLHVKGTANASQLIIDANSTQSNTNPLIKLRNSSGTELMWINSDNPNNTFIGLNAGRVNDLSTGVGTWNTFIGSNAGYSNTTGFQNTANGMDALYSNTIGYHNTANGYATLYLNTEGNHNTASGRSALHSNTIGNYNTANGYRALYSNVAGSNATAIGTNAMQYANDQSSAFTNSNVAVGYEALRGSGTPSANTGNSNTAIGYQTLWSNTSGASNTANGFKALYSNSTGGNNTANGEQALYTNTVGEQNTANGWQALYNNTQGSFNTANGVGALYNNSQGNYNTGNGINALLSNTIGNRNTALGFGADVLSNNLTNATAIGYNAKVASSNSLVLGGTGADAVNVGIGTTAPSSKLHLQSADVVDVPRGDLVLSRYWASNANTRASSVFHYYNSSAANDNLAFAVSGTGGSDAQPNQLSQIKMVIQASGNVGIGTTNPVAKLNVSAGDASFALFGPNGWGGQLIVGAAPNQGVALTAQVLTSDGNLHIDPAPSHNIYIGHFQPNNVIVNAYGGNVGIGTTTPAATLEVNGYTKLGSDAPSIKVKKLTSTTAATEGNYVNIGTGVASSKILSVSVMVSYATDIWIGPYYGVAGYNFRWVVAADGSISVVNYFGDSANILSKPIKILITYEP